MTADTTEKRRKRTYGALLPTKRRLTYGPAEWPLPKTRVAHCVQSLQVIIRDTPAPTASDDDLRKFAGAFGAAPANPALVRTRATTGSRYYVPPLDIAGSVL
jgi:hypothetical protein